jgi:hypothetical protein
MRNGMYGVFYISCGDIRSFVSDLSPLSESLHAVSLSHHDMSGILRVEETVSSIGNELLYLQVQVCDKQPTSSFGI